MCELAFVNLFPAHSRKEEHVWYLDFLTSKGEKSMSALFPVFRI